MKYAIDGDTYIGDTGVKIKDLVTKGRAFYNGYATSDQTIEYGSQVQITSMSVSLATTGRDILVTTSFAANISVTNGTATFTIYVDGKRYTTAPRIATVRGNATLTYCNQIILKNIPAGNHTITLYGQADSNYSLILPAYYGRSMSAIEL